MADDKVPRNTRRVLVTAAMQVPLSQESVEPLGYEGETPPSE
jgi:uncharacterized protein (UPF0147 family)